MPDNTRPLLDPAQRAEFQRLNRTKAICCLPYFDDAPKEALIQFDYLSKGAANVVYTIHRAEKPFTNAFLFVHVQDQGSSATAISNDQVIDRVLRVPRGRAKHLTSDDIVAGFEQAVRPVFLSGKVDAVGSGENLENSEDEQVQVPVEPDQDLSKYLMDLKRVAFLPGVMAHLAHLAHFTEPGTFEQGVDNSGLLLPDMSPVPDVSISLEIKPKWLLQSPTAPASAVRCRTCAMQVAIPKHREIYLCPLRLVYGTQPDLRDWAWYVLADHFGGTADVSKDTQKQVMVSRLVRRLIDYLVVGDGRTLLLHIQYLESKLDPQGILKREQVHPNDVFDRNSRLAMTLRDSSWFIMIPFAVNAPITSKLGDLDFKSGEKLVDWADKELMLLQSEMYTKVVADGPECWLGRTDKA
ncbi:Inositol-pentakisphosphate 2-kinase [Neocucurbitaria cava]|uniref:Inositol-pentakisphosphate 2-kinase n=1 Tax=Neocucurbitaria cava TaxID=798079 RepID=A0A9W8YHJ8_9PLEO|nr:Inositol-pentakisphosphate 2-kinase [Neocucurbitaria cava]